MNLLGLLGGCDLAGADGPVISPLAFGQISQCKRNGTVVPDRLISNDNLAPVLHLVRDGLELRGDNLNRLVRLPLLQALAAAQNHAEAAVQGCLGLGRNECVVLLQDHAALRVAEDGPCDAAILELLRRDLAGEGAAGLVEDVLGSDLEALAQVLAGEEEVERWRSDDDLCGWCELFAFSSCN